MHPARLAELQRGTRTGISLYSTWALEDFLPSSVGTAAEMMLATTCTAFLIGKNREVEPLLEKAYAWLIDSRERDERARDHPEYHAMQRSQAIGLSSWLLGHESRDAFGEAVRLHQEHLTANRPSREDLLERHLPDLVRNCLAADRPALGVEIYRRLVGAPPGSSEDVGTPLELAAWLCDALSAWRRPADWVHVAERVLGTRLLDGPERGEAMELALWLKLTYADSGAAPTPAEALRRGGQLAGTLPSDPLARLLLDSLGDPVDIDLLTGFLAALIAQVRPVGRVEVRLADAERIVVPAEPARPGDGTDELKAAIAAALRAPYQGELGERLAAAVRGRLVAVDGQTPLTLDGVTIS